jgi:OOP family OmpA-OmpF porin
MSYQEQDIGTSGSTVGAPTVYPDQVAVSLTFEAEPLFNFDKAFIRGDQRRILDEFVASLAGTEYESIEAVGFADRIGPEAYNQKLSERRAEAVKAYLAAKGIPAGKIRTEGRGEAETITGDACAKMRGKALIGCFQPDRRVDVTVTAVKLTN